jgi:hypothetical protein
MVSKPWQKITIKIAMDRDILEESIDGGRTDRNVN